MEPPDHHLQREPGVPMPTQSSKASGIPPSPEPTVRGRSAWRLCLERLRRDRIALAALAFIGLTSAVAIGAPLLASLVGHAPDAQYRDAGLTPEGLPKPPNKTFWLGTDDLGRDLFVRIAYGARISLLVSLLGTALTLLIGVVIGMLAGYYGGLVDTVLSRFTDLILSFPFFLLAVAMVSIVGQSLPLLILVIALFGWSAVARVVRGQTLVLRQQEFVQAALSVGAGDGRIIVRELLPNVAAPILVYAALLVPSFVVLESTLAFLGLGVPPPNPTWGGMLSDAVRYYRQAWWYVAFPGAALLGTTVAFNLLADSVRDALAPQARPWRH